MFPPEDRHPTAEEEVFSNIFDYIDRLFLMIRQEGFIHGYRWSCTRAKMNQQRSRRFRAAQERSGGEGNRRGKAEREINQRRNRGAA